MRRPAARRAMSTPVAGTCTSSWELLASIANSVVVVAVPKLFEYAEPTISGLPGLSVP